MAWPVLWPVAYMIYAVPLYYYCLGNLHHKHCRRYMVRSVADSNE
jgi:hypothetical protein